MAERVTDISELNPGDRIWSVTGDEVEILRFVAKHPENEGYSLMLNSSKDAPKFYNEDLKTRLWFRFDDSVDCWNDIHAAQRDYHLQMAAYYKSIIK